MSTESSSSARRWTPGTLPTIELEQILTDVLSDLWNDAYRRDRTVGERVRQFRRTVETSLYCATGREIWLREERG